MQDSNLWPPHYECDALPTELIQRNDIPIIDLLQDFVKYFFNLE